MLDLLAQELLDAAAAGDATRVTSALAAGAYVDVRDMSGWTALIRASAEGHIDVVDVLLRAGASVYMTASGRTALNFAASQRHVGVVKRLLSAGVNVNHIGDRRGALPLLDAIWGMRDAVVDVLVAAGAHVNFENSYGQSPLKIACRINYVYGVKRLLAAGVDTGPSASGCETALMLAARAGFEGARPAAPRERR